jgi:cytochrome oxidase Cu insertion factor (SCO1/SenC/PrrC family)
MRFSHVTRVASHLASLAAIFVLGFAAPATRAGSDCQTGQAEPKSLAFVVRYVDRRPAGEFVVTFENGEVWQQSDLKNKVIIARGDQVVIRRSSSGTFTLVSRDGQSTRVKRVN